LIWVKDRPVNMVEVEVMGDHDIDFVDNPVAPASIGRSSGITVLRVPRRQD